MSTVAAPMCRWCGKPDVDLIRIECADCGCMRRPSEPDEDADIEVVCDRCGGASASMGSGLCQGCDR